MKEIDNLRIRNELYGWKIKKSYFDELESKCERYMDNFNVVNAPIEIIVDTFRKGKLVLKKDKYSGNDAFNLNLEKDNKNPIGMVMIAGNQLKFEVDKRTLENLSAILVHVGIEDKEFRTLEDAKKQILDKLSEEQPHWMHKKLNVDVYKVFIELFNAKHAPAKVESDELRVIVAVIESSDGHSRLYIEASSNEYEIKHIKTSHPAFNFIDVGRVIYQDKIFFQGLEEKDIDIDVIKEIGSELDGNMLVVDRGVYDDHIKRFAMNLKKEKEKIELTSLLTTEIGEKIRELDNKPFNYKDITFSKNYIEYGGIRIGGAKCNLIPFIKQKIDFDEDNINFNTIFDRFIQVVWSEEFKAGRNNEFVVGNIKIRPMVKKVEGRTNYAMHSHINGIRINNEETLECLRRALCYHTQKDYNGFLLIVHKCSLKVHKILSEGLVYRFADTYEPTDDEKFVRLKVIRKKGINYVKTSTNELKLSNTNKMIFKQGSAKYSRIMSLDALLSFLEDALKLTTNEVLEIVKDGLREYKEAIRKSEQLLAETLKQIKARKATATSVNNGEMEGYIVKGVSGKEYFVSEKKVQVFKYPSMDYICIVSQQVIDVVGKDKLVSYLLALSNDSYVAKDIDTLRV